MDGAVQAPCPMCTFLNPSTSESCSVCGALMVPDRPLDQDDPEMPAVAPLAPEGGEAAEDVAAATQLSAQISALASNNAAGHHTAGLALLLLLLMTLLYDSVLGLHFLVVSVAVLASLEARLRDQVARKAEASRLALVAQAVCAATYAGLAYVLSCSESDGCIAPFARTSTLVFRAHLGPDDASLLDTLFLVTVNDAAIRAATLAIKAAWLAAAPPGSAAKQLRVRRQHLALIEVTSVIYRELVSVQPWIHFYGSGRAIGAALVLAYLGIKAMAVGYLVAEVGSTLDAFQRGIAETRPLSEADLAEAGEGGDCPICFDAYAAPVALSCDHAFCEECIHEWLEKEKTCPICRARVVDDSVPRTLAMAYMDGSMSLIPTML